jgi:AraC family transcriptional regulator
MVGVMYFKPKEQRGHPHEVQYIAGSFVSQAPSAAELPAGMISYTVPSATFAVFTHRGPITQLGRTLDAIYKEWLPQSGYRHSGVADVEIYGCKFIHNGPESEMEYWISVEKVPAGQRC